MTGEDTWGNGGLLKRSRIATGSGAQDSPHFKRGRKY
jgi:hypothetical protein